MIFTTMRLKSDAIYKLHCYDRSYKIVQAKIYEYSVKKVGEFVSPTFLTLFPIEGIAADEFPDQAGGRDLVIHAGFPDKIQDLDHGSDLVIIGILRLDCGQQRIDMLLQHRQFIQSGTVEDHIRFLLIREDPSALPALHRIPHGQCVLHRRTTGLIIPHRSAQQPQITGGDAVVIVQIQGQQGADIQLEDQTGLHMLRGQHRVQCVESLDDDNAVLLQPNASAVPLPLAGLEVELRQFDLLPFHQTAQVIPDQIGV